MQHVFTRPPGGKVFFLQRNMYSPALQVYAPGGPRCTHSIATRSHPAQCTRNMIKALTHFWLRQAFVFLYQYPCHLEDDWAFSGLRQAWRATRMMKDRFVNSFTTLHWQNYQSLSLPLPGHGQPKPHPLLVMLQSHPLQWGPLSLYLVLHRWCFSRKIDLDKWEEPLHHNFTWVIVVRDISHSEARINYNALTLPPPFISAPYCTARCSPSELSCIVDNNIGKKEVWGPF